MVQTEFRGAKIVQLVIWNEPQPTGHPQNTKQNDSYINLLW